jgi:tetratricopeptide (TPR) repeat protein
MIHCDHPLGVVVYPHQGLWLQAQHLVVPELELPIEVDPIRSIEALQESAANAFKANRYLDAIADYDEALQQPNCSKDQRLLLLSNRARCHLQRENGESALLDSEEALTLDPEHQKSRFRRAHALLLLQRPDEARKELLLCEKSNLTAKLVCYFMSGLHRHISYY